MRVVTVAYEGSRLLLIDAEERSKNEISQNSEQVRLKRCENIGGMLFFLVFLVDEILDTQKHKKQGGNQLAVFESYDKACEASRARIILGKVSL
jgi:hypothetical protein